LTFLFLLVATWNFRPWYLIWLVALLALLPVGWPFWRTLVWTAGALLAYAHFIWVAHWWEADFNARRNVGVLIEFGPVIALSLVQLGRAVLARAPAAGSTRQAPSRSAAADG
jgi:hypothetical protein